MTEIKIDKETNGKTLKDYLRGDMSLSSGMMKRLKFRDGGITVNGEHVTVRYILKTDDILRLNDEDREEDTCPYMIPIDLDIGILYEDSEICAVNKPPNMPAHPSQSHRLDTVANALAYRYSSSPYVFRPVNRLDRDTSGIMLTANTRMAASALYKSMVSGEIVKMYIAILSKEPDADFGEIKAYMKRLEGSVIERRTASPDEAGAKPALTYYKKLYTDSVSGRCAVLCAPVTGRTHQLRVHFASIGCAICGDTLYRSADNAIDRQALHAAYLSFPHPKTNESIRIFSPLPKDICNLMGEEKSRKVEQLFRASVNEELEKYIKELKSSVR